MFRDWLINNNPELESFVYKNGAVNTCLIAERLKVLDGFEKKVLSHHTSKSIKLPVFHFENKNLGISFVFRCNFHDWCIAIDTKASPKEFPEFISKFFEYEGFFEGMEYVSNYKYQICVSDEYDLVSVISYFLTLDFLGDD